MIKILRPKHFLLGVLLGFFCCCLAGYLISMKARLHHFSRFFLAIQPQTLYYPTASELLQTVKHEMTQDKILVLIGGSSIFRGDGQDPNEVWSDKLQQLLGDQFKVINFATDGASFSSFGGVVFRMLRDKYPKIIFVAAAYQFNSEGNMDGLPPYDYLFWDAYYKKLFHPYKNEDELIKKMRNEEMKTSAGVEQHLMSLLDSYFYFRSLWNWINYHFIFTIFSEYEYQTPFRPRRLYHDEYVPPEYKKLLFQVFNDPEHIEKSKKFIEQCAESQVVDLSKKPLKIIPSVITSGVNGYNAVFQPFDRAKILMVQTIYNTHVLSSVPKKFQEGYWFVNQRSHIMIQSLGYNVIDVGEDFSGDDYKDIDHFRASGGKKLAIQVANEVKRIAISNGYYS